MAMYSFGMESFTSETCRGQFGQDDLWLIVTVVIGNRVSDAGFFWIGTPQQAGQGFIGPWVSGPYALDTGESGVATYTVVNLGGSSQEDQSTEIAGLGASVLTAATQVGTAMGSVETAILGVFGSSGELVGGKALPAGVPDCRGLVGVYLAPFTPLASPQGNEVQLSDPISLTAATPASCGAPTQSSAVFSVRLQPNLFTKSTPLTCLAGDYTSTAIPGNTATVEIFGVGQDGLAYCNVRTATGISGAWLPLGQQTFSQTAPLVAVAGAPQRKDLFGIGTDGMIYTLQWRPPGGWGNWTAVSSAGQFVPDTPVSAIAMYGIVILAAVDLHGTAQSIAWNNDSVTYPWAPLPGLSLAPKTPLLVMSHVETVVEVFAANQADQDFHTSRGVSSPTWGAWQSIGGVPPITEPASRRYVGLTFQLYVKPNQSKGLGMLMLRVDGTGTVNKLGWSQDTSWFHRTLIPGIKNSAGGSLSGVAAGDELVLYMVDAQTGRIAAAGWPTPIPFQGDTPWGGWSLLQAGPTFAPDRQVTALAQGTLQTDLFVVDLQGVVRHLGWSTATGWQAWSLL